MKRTKRQIFGFLLLMGVILFGILFQWLGPGLIVTQQPPLTRAAVVQGTVITQLTSYHNALVPLAISGITGLLLALLPDRGVTSFKHDRPPVCGFLSIVGALLGLLFGYLAPYAPGWAGVFGVITALSTCTIGLVLGLAAMVRLERFRWLAPIGVLLSIGSSFRYFTGA